MDIVRAMRTGERALEKRKREYVFFFRFNQRAVEKREREYVLFRF